MKIPRSDERFAFAQRLSITRLFNFDEAFFVEAFRERAGEDFRHVLDDHDWRTIQRQSIQECAESFRAAGGRTDHKQFLKRASIGAVAQWRENGVSGKPRWRRNATPGKNTGLGGAPDGIE